MGISKEIENGHIEEDESLVFYAATNGKEGLIIAAPPKLQRAIEQNSPFLDDWGIDCPLFPGMYEVHGKVAYESYGYSMDGPNDPEFTIKDCTFTSVWIHDVTALHEPDWFTYD